jgi:hypothetical protein
VIVDWIVDWPFSNQSTLNINTQQYHRRSGSAKT